MIYLCMSGILFLVSIFFLISAKRIKVKKYKQQQELNKEVALLEKQKDEILGQLLRKQKAYREEVQKAEESLNKIKANGKEAAEKYAEDLKNKYQKEEQKYRDKTLLLNKEIKKIQSELKKMQETKLAAQQALLKEQEVKDNKDNYRLIPENQDLRDIAQLQKVKKLLRKPRILSMLIWQTYWQPLAKKVFPIILQDKTKMGIYKITSLDTEECYIGQAVDIYKRWSQHCKAGLGIDTPPGNKLYKAIEKYGLNNFTFEVLTECKKEELNEKEKYFINLYHSDLYGYNGTKGNN